MGSRPTRLGFMSEYAGRIRYLCMYVRCVCCMYVWCLGVCFAFGVFIWVIWLGFVYIACLVCLK